MTERRRNEQRVRSALQELEAPDEQQAAERARQVVEAAFDEHSPAPPHSPLLRRAGLAVLAAAAIAGFALTPAGAEVREWIADTVDPGEENAEPRLTSLPAAGTVLVEATSGAWTINDDGSKRLLGDYELATWSPNGRFIGVSSGSELRAIDPGGTFRWSIEAPEPIEALDWSSDEGFRVAYLAKEEVRVVAGDGTGDELVARTTRPVAPVWRPEDDATVAEHALTYVDRKNRIVLEDIDDDRIIWRTASFVAISELEWSSDGERLLVEAGDYKTVYDMSGNPVVKGPLTKPVGIGHATVAPSGDSLAMVRKGKNGPELVLISVPSGRERVLYRTDTDARGEEFDAPVFSPDGEWILLPWRAADQWLFIQIENRRVIAVADIARQFESPDDRRSFPRVAGWCCAGG